MAANACDVIAGNGKGQLIQQAKLAQQAERYDNMAAFMKSATETGIQHTYEERCLFSTAYKKIINARRSSWRVVRSLVSSFDGVSEGKKQETTIAYRGTIEIEINSICKDILYLVDSFLLPSATTPDNKVFYQQMQADAYRYLAEIAVGDNREEMISASQKVYEETYELCHACMEATHPVRLALALNYAVFCYDIKNSQAKAREVAQLAFDEALAELDLLNKENRQESTKIIQLLKKNIVKWTPEPVEVVEVEEVED